MEFGSAQNTRKHQKHNKMARILARASHVIKIMFSKKSFAKTIHPNHGSIMMQIYGNRKKKLLGLGIHEVPESKRERENQVRSDWSQNIFQDTDVLTGV